MGGPSRHVGMHAGVVHGMSAMLRVLCVQRFTYVRCIGRRRSARTFSTVLELMDRYPEYRFVVSQAQHLAWMRDLYPDLWERMKKRIAEGRLEPTGTMWVEADSNIPSGESLGRPIVYSLRPQIFSVNTGSGPWALTASCAKPTAQKPACTALMARRTHWSSPT